MGCRVSSGHPSLHSQGLVFSVVVWFLVVLRREVRALHTDPLPGSTVPRPDYAPLLCTLCFVRPALQTAHLQELAFAEICQDHRPPHESTVLVTTCLGSLTVSVLQRTGSGGEHACRQVAFEHLRGMKPTWLRASAYGSHQIHTCTVLDTLMTTSYTCAKHQKMERQK